MNTNRIRIADIVDINKNKNSNNSGMVVVTTKEVVVIKFPSQVCTL